MNRPSGSSRRGAPGAGPAPVDPGPVDPGPVDPVLPAAGPGDGASADPTPFESWDRPRGAWMLPGRCRHPARRTLMLETTTRALFPTILVFSVYLLCVGHYGPGGGFSAGLVAGLAFVLRYIAGGSVDPGGLLAVRPTTLMGVGLVVAVATALAPLLAGEPVLSSAKLVVPLPPLGEVDVVTSLFLDVGVYLLIVGVVLDLLRALGSGVERDMRSAGEGT